jgi:hypothetical protein
VNNAGIKLQNPSRHEPVIGDDFDLETYGRPSTQRAAARAHAEHGPRRARAAEVNPYDTEGGVRTVKIRGQATPARRRAAVEIQRYDRRPDRAAQWALFMGVFMVAIAIVTGT